MVIVFFSWWIDDFSVWVYMYLIFFWPSISKFTCLYKILLDLSMVTFTPWIRQFFCSQSSWFFVVLLYLSSLYLSVSLCVLFNRKLWMMPSKPKNDNQRLEQGAHNVLQSTVYSSQPWWRAVGNDLPMGESTPNSSLVEHQNGSLINGAIQSRANGRLDTGANFNNKEMHAIVAQFSSYPLKGLSLMMNAMWNCFF